eukprot:1024843-Alexandrium_andersonii.AAC.1
MASPEVDGPSCGNPFISNFQQNNVVVLVEREVAEAPVMQQHNHFSGTGMQGCTMRRAKLVAGGPASSPRNSIPEQQMLLPYSK